MTNQSPHAVQGSNSAGYVVKPEVAPSAVQVKFNGHIVTPIPADETNSVTQTKRSSLKERIRNFVVRDFAKFAVPLTWSRLRVAVGNWHYCDNLKGVGGGSLFVGAIPLRNNIDNLIDKMKDTAEPQKKEVEVAFLSVVEPHETLAGIVYKPALERPKGGTTVTKEHTTHPKDETKKQNVKIENMHCPEADFSGKIQTNWMKQGVDFIKKCVDEKKPLYVHCKAGRSRSVSYMSAYLMAHEYEKVQNDLVSKGQKSALNELREKARKEGTTPSDIEIRAAKLKDVLAYMKSQRIQVDVGKGKMGAILLFCLENDGVVTPANRKEYEDKILEYYKNKPKKSL